MNRMSLPSPTANRRATTTAAKPASPAQQRPYPERDFGIGYGRSSGYASARQYVSGWNGLPRFRCL